MLARNPKTGGTIRVLTSNTSCWKENKTLYWRKSTDDHRAPWDSAVFSVKEDFWLYGYKPAMVFLLEDLPENRKWLKSMEARDTRFIFIKRALVEGMGELAFQALNLGNVLCVEELPSMYPFLGKEWDGTPEDALVMAALVFRYQKVVSHMTASLRTSQFCSLGFLPADIRPKPFVLIQQFYKAPQAARARELELCFKNNLDNPLIQKIYMFGESKDLQMPKHHNAKDKLVFIVKKGRITYADCIQLILSKIGPGHIVGCANTDIYFDETLEQLWSVNMSDTLFALLRWEYTPNGTPQLFGPRADSQDSWILDSDSVLARPESAWTNGFDIPFGKAGCDNAILIEFLRQKFKIINPALSLKTLHVHGSKIRNYDPQDIVDRPVYMHVEPSGIHELNPLITYKGWADSAVIHEPLDRPLKATTPKMLGIFCSQMNRDTSFVWSATGTNTYLAPVEQDHRISIQDGGFVNPAGLVYKHTDLCVGSTDIQKTIWSENRLSHIMPAQETLSMMAFPLETKWFKDAPLFTLNYLSRVLDEHNRNPQASFWCTKTNALLSAFQLFRWKEPRGHLLRYSEETQAFSKEIVGRTAHQVRVGRLEVNALRSSLFMPWAEDPVDSTVVLVEDELHIKDDLLDNIETLFKEKGYTVLTVDSNAMALEWAKTLRGASRIVLSSSLKSLAPTWAWAWMAPKGCKILELQEEREPSDSLVHLAAAADLEWTLLQYPRATPDGLKKIILKEVAKWLSTSDATTGLPVVYVPPKSMKFGFFGHKGDSFRELVELWAEKGFVERKEDPVLTQCWLNGVGKTLLYDRPTWDWLEKSSDAERSYKQCLAGNPDPSEKPSTKPWIFWPRMPRLVEHMAGEATNTFSEREDTLVFYGRIENDKQGSYRQDVSGWASVCTKFQMPIGAKEPYPLSPSDYLRALQNAKYGLCLRGYGPKCNREIELLAMGTVPLITPGVDYKNYSEPLEDGVHVLCVSSPEDAVAKMAAMSEDGWTLMSEACKAWWKRNASAEGSWSKTRVLVDGC
jgi:hypothetical protein